MKIHNKNNLKMADWIGVEAALF